MLDNYEKLLKDYDSLNKEYNDMIDEYNCMVDKYNALIEFLHSAVRFNTQCASMSNIRECPKGMNLLEYTASVYQSVLNYLNK